MLVRRTFSVVPFVALAYGGPLTLTGRNPNGACNVGKIECCQNMSTSNSAEFLNTVDPVLLDLLAALPANTPIGMGCINSGAGSGIGCNANPVCCENAVYQNGLVNVGCAPLDLGEL